MKKNLISAKIWVAPTLICLFFLLITCGAAAVSGVENSGGRVLTGLFVTLAESNALVAHLLAGISLFAAFLGMLLLAQGRSKKTVWLASVLALAVPVSVYSQTYGSLNGALTVAPAAALSLFYMVLLEKVLASKHQKARYALPLFLVGLAAAFFHEALALGLCLLSVGMTVKYWKRGSWILLMHSLAACGGCAVSLLFSMDASLFAATELLYRAERVVDGVLVENWAILLLLTGACLLLIQPLRSDRSKRCNQVLQELLVPVAFFALCPYLKTVPLFGAAMKLLFAAVYVRGLRMTVKIYVSRDHRRHQTYRLLAAVAAMALPCLFVAEPNDGLLYLPCLLLAAVTLLLWNYALQRYEKLAHACHKLLPAIGVIALCCCVWIGACNSMTDEVRREYIRQQETAGATEIVLPEYPFAAYRGEDPARVTPLAVTYCPWEDWDWSAYYASRASADSEEPIEEEKIPNFNAFKEEEE